MKVLIIPSWYPTELNSLAGVFFREQAIALQKNGVEVIVAYSEFKKLRKLNKYNLKLGRISGVEEGIKTYRFRTFNPLPKIKKFIPILNQKVLEKNYEIIEKTHGKPDIIHAHSILWGGYAASKLAFKYNIPLVITEHSSSYSRNLIKDWQVPYISSALKIASEVIAVGPGLKNNLEHYTKKEIKLVPNIVDVESFSLNYKKEERSVFRFFSLAFLTRNKGMDSLLHAFSSAFSSHERSVELVIGGEGKEKKNLEELAIHLGIRERVLFLGELSRERVIEEMQRCDAFVLASRKETFGVVYIEALACGKPIIATKNGGPDDIVNEMNGILVNVDDVMELSNALTNIYINYELYNPYEIRKDCIKRFSSEAVSNQLINIYKNIEMN